MDDKITKKGVDETEKKPIEEEEIKAEAKETIPPSGQTTTLKMAGIALFALVFGVGLGYLLFGLSAPTGAVIDYEDTTTTVDITPTTIPGVEGVKDGDMAKVNYVGYFENGTIFDTSIESIAKEAGLYDSQRPYEPLMVMLGSGMVIPGFNDGLIGMLVGEDKTIEIPQEEGYPVGPLANKTLYFNVTLVEIVEPVDIKLTVLNDKRCDKCDVTSVISQLKMMFPKLDVGEIDYATDDGKKLYQDLGLKYLPALLFNKSIESSENYGNVEGYMEEVGDYYSLRIGAGFDPTAEICDNGIDDNDDGLVDCDDPTCKNKFVCMPKLDKPVVELFVMSHCPYGTQTEKGMLPVAKLLGDKIDFSIKFCSYVMHGKTEIDEQTLEYCVQKDQADKYLDYMSCFLEEGNTDECLEETGIDRGKLGICINQTDLEFKITENYEDKSTWLSGSFPVFDIHKEENERYGIGGSPGLAVNGVNVPSFGRDPKSLLDIVCAGFKEKPDECSEELSTASPSPGFGFSGTGEGSSASCGG